MKMKGVATDNYKYINMNSEMCILQVGVVLLFRQVLTKDNKNVNTWGEIRHH